MSRFRLRTATAVAAAGILALSAAGCVQSERTEGSQTKKDTLVFGVAGDAKVLDPALASDGESFRVAREVFEGLLRAEPGGTKIVPSLAESWSPDSTGLIWTFKLKSGVKFHDGTDFNGEAVCANFNRWYNWSGLMQGEDISTYWQDIFGGFAKNESEALPPSLFKSCGAPDAGTAVITIARVTSKFPAALILPAFSMSSPKALTEFEANKVGGTGDNITYPPYATDHPVGTGPYKFVKWDRTNKVVEMEAFEGYHNTKAKIKNLKFKTIVDLSARKQALRAGEIQGYDLVAPADIKPLSDEGFQVLPRPAFNIFYLALNQAGNPALKKVEVRQAIAYAINKQAIIDSKYPVGSTVATNFCPPTLAGCDAATDPHAYDPTKAKSLLAAAGVTGLKLRFHYPTEVTRPYMPAPKDIFELISADLKAVGIEVTPMPLKWTPDYLNAVQVGTAHDIHLLGWTGDYSDAYNFIGTFFDRQKQEWGFNDPALFAEFKAADSEPDAAKRTEMYRALGVKLALFTPGVPIAHGPPSLVLSKEITGLKASPLTDERFDTAEYK